MGDPVSQKDAPLLPHVATFTVLDICDALSLVPV
jgi:hypothetical protein